MSKVRPKSDKALVLSLTCPRCKWRGKRTINEYGLSVWCPKCHHKPLMPTLAKQSKYKNVKTEVDGVVYDSAREAKRHGELQLMERVGQISNLRRQVSYELKVGGVLVAKYIADHVYDEGGAEVVEDSKGIRTRDYAIKRKLMKALYGIAIREV